MSDPHHNVFYYYRGPSTASTDQWAEEERQHRQVEDNTTKALINLLEHGDPALTVSFLHRFIGQGVPTGRVGEIEPRCYLQRGPTGDISEPRWLLGLSVMGAIDPASLDALATNVKGRVDAAVHLPGVALLLIEVKTVEYLDWPQLVRHAADWTLPEPLSHATHDAPLKLARWRDVYAWAKAQRPVVGDPVSGFLLDQFTNYLEVIGMSPFMGFGERHFDYLAASPPKRVRNLEHQTEIKARLRSAWEAVFDELEPREIEALGEIHVGQLGPEDVSGWAQTNRGAGGVNLTIELWPGELQVDLVAWVVPDATPFERWLTDRGGTQARRELEGFELVVFKRRAHEGPSGNPYWQRETFEELGRVSATEIDSRVGWETLSSWEAALDPEWEKLAYHLRRAWPREQVAARGQELVPDLVAAVKRLVPLIRQINKV